MPNLGPPPPEREPLRILAMAAALVLAAIAGALLGFGLDSLTKASAAHSESPARRH